ncbi:hypothetical protein WJX84_001237 [Apatococcus fuscideae]|uniref:Holocytochrome c-type synthase n=1 Tax=Apatococcus fuscideae TaxID=2026836 RepID=A0AAW1SXH6_9CHLO
MGASNSREPDAPATAPPRASQMSSNCPVAEEPGALPEGSCPLPEKYRSPNVYNVYNQKVDPSGAQQSPMLRHLLASAKLDPRNNMPLEPNQRPWPGQEKPISTERIVSTIPKGGTDGTWVYPSPQMFYNALMRKGKGEDVKENDMDSVILAHNSMNELTWRKVQQWEGLHPVTQSEATLLRFCGRPDNLSPLAWVHSWLDGRLPFDRHDWYVDRQGQEVRYVIDFYFDEDKAGSPDAFKLRVRPALDSVEAGMDRLRMNIYRKCAQWGVPCPLTGAPSQHHDAEQQHASSPASA